MRGWGMEPCIELARCGPTSRSRGLDRQRGPVRKGQDSKAGGAFKGSAAQGSTAPRRTPGSKRRVDAGALGAGGIGPPFEVGGEARKGAVERGAAVAL